MPMNNARFSAVHVALSMMARAARTLPLADVEEFAVEAEQLHNSAVAQLTLEQRDELKMAAPVAQAFVAFRKAVDAALKP